MVFESRMRIVEPRRDDVAWEWGKMHNEELRKL
jgi:hypothetical protein